MTREETGGGLFLHYKVHALIGDERALPTSKDSMKNLVKVSAIPAAFVAGCFATAISAGMLVGPSLALAPLVSGLVVNGVVVDSAALAAGAIMATRAQVVTDLLLKTHPDKFMCKTKRLKPGRRYLVVKGGLSDGPVSIGEMSQREFNKLKIAVWKKPLPKDDAANNVQYILGGEADDDETLAIEQK